MKMETMKNLISATLIITVATSLLFVAGSTANSTYLQTFGISPKIFQYDMQTNLEMGGAILYVGWIYILIFGLIFSSSALCLVWIVNQLSKDQLIKSIASGVFGLFKNHDKTTIKRSANLIISKILRLCLYISFTLILASTIAIAYYTIIIFSSNLAKDQALEKIKQLTNQPEEQNELEFTIDGVKEVGYLIAADKENIAIFCTDETNNEAIIRIIRRNNVTNIQKEYIPD